DYDTLGNQILSFLLCLFVHVQKDSFQPLYCVVYSENYLTYCRYTYRRCRYLIPYNNHQYCSDVEVNKFNFSLAIMDISLNLLRSQDMNIKNVLSEKIAGEITLSPKPWPDHSQMA
ncbi:hypothetical protein MBGDC06_00120, partial [Thermoplasmatales archaeon SCGC AB-539-C06]